jgi:4-amino-4-deoxy-L-arabinose transferase-like glycosyltransferase
VAIRPPPRDSAGLKIAIALSILAAVGNGIWLFVDHSVPSWDQSHYLTVALQYQRSFEAGGVVDLLRAIHGTDPSHGPLFTVALLPFIAIFGASARSGLLLNLLVAPLLYFSAGEIAWILFRKRFARLLTIVLAGTTPIVVGLFHNVLQDFLLVTLATVSILLLLKSEGFQRRGYTIAMAVAMALGTLNKVTFPAFVAGPVVVVVAAVVLALIPGREALSPIRVDRRRLAWNAGIGLAVFLVLVALWYGPNLHETIEYIRSTTSGPLSEGAGPANPFTFHAIVFFTTGVVDYQLSWVILLLGLLAVALDWRRLLALFRRPIRPGPLWALALLLAWVLVPYLSVALAHNQDPRLMAAAFPGVAILVAGAVSFIGWREARYGLAGLAVVILAYQVVNHVTDITPSGVGQVKVDLGEYEQVIAFDRKPIGYEEIPRPDRTSPLLDYVESVAGKEPGGKMVPRLVCLLQSEPTVNYNTLSFLSAARADPFVFTDVTEKEGEPNSLEEQLSACDFAIYIPQPKTSAAGEESRVALFNDPYAAHHMTPKLLSLFDGASRRFPVFSAAYPSGEAVAYVLVRTPPAKAASEREALG